MKRTRRGSLLSSILPQPSHLSISRREKVDIAIIETGLGGRLDSTNVIEPLVSIITNVDYDHTEQLGSSLEQIAAEKAGIIKTGYSRGNRL